MCRILRDAELLEAKLGKIDDGEELGAHMVNIVKAKHVASRPKANTNEGMPT
jgi:vacuolar protein sorting-associated protein 54